MHHRSHSLALLLALLAPALVLGLPEDRDQPIQLVADRARLDQKTGISVYEGDVVITQGSMRLAADTVTIYTKDKAFERLVAVGKPATFRYQPAPDKDVINGEGRRLDYDAGTGLVVITNDAKITQAKDVFSGDRIEYDLSKDLVSARMAENGGERVQVTIQPKSGAAPKK